MTPRVGFGLDVHRFSSPGVLRLGGIVVDADRGVEATSDGDLAAHAVTDAVLGVAGLGDMGEHFPSTDSRWQGADSLEMLAKAVAMARDRGVTVTFVDVTVISQSVRVAPHRDAIAGGIASAVGLARPSVSVKATTTDHVGFVGRDEGLAVTAVVTATIA